MNEALLFLIGGVVFAITSFGALFYGYLVFDRLYQAGLADSRERLAAAEDL